MRAAPGPLCARRSADNAPMTMTVSCVNVPRPAGAGGVLRLTPAAGPVEIGPLGFGSGPDVPSPEDSTIAPADHALAYAVYAYPTAHHAFWRTVRAQAGVTPREEPVPPASFDEHLALDGIQESQLWVGDLLRFAHCTLAVSGPRLPDARFDATLGFAHAAKMVAQSRWCGCWLAVRAAGTIETGDAFEVVPGPRAIGVVELFRDRLRPPRA
jgi:MOSC domain-containing protein YiiM